MLSLNDEHLICAIGEGDLDDALHAFGRVRTDRLGWLRLARLSAERAVDADLIQSTLESGELLVVELGNEQLRDPAHMNRSRVGEAGHAGVGQRDHDATPVRARGAATN